MLWLALIGWLLFATCAANAVMTEWFRKKAFERCDDYVRICERCFAVIEEQQEELQQLREFRRHVRGDTPDPMRSLRNVAEVAEARNGPLGAY